MGCEQHDDHCVTTFFGQNWRIQAVRGAVIALMNETGITAVDVSGVDWPAYCATARQFIEARNAPEA